MTQPPATPLGEDLFTGWLVPHDVAWFSENHLQKTPYACPGAATNATSLLAWETLDRILRGGHPLDVLTVAQGQLIDVPTPRSLEDVSRLMKSGVSVVVRASERNDPGLAALARSFERALPGEVHVQVYATPGGTHSYGWHYDFEDVFIAQTAGVKDYFFRKNTVARDTVLGDPLDFSVFRHETSPMFSSQLLAGDWLYLPATWWHLVKCVEDSLSISVGIMPRQAFQRARRVPTGWSGQR